MYDDEHPLEIAIAWTLAGLVCGVFLLTKLGAFNPSKKTPSEVFSTPYHQSLSLSESDKDEKILPVLQ